MIIENDDFCTIPGESDHGNPIFKDDQNEPDLLNSFEVAVESDETTAGKCSRRGTITENFPEYFAQTDNIDDGTDTDH